VVILRGKREGPTQKLQAKVLGITHGVKRRVSTVGREGGKTSISEEKRKRKKNTYHIPPEGDSE